MKHQRIAVSAFFFINGFTHANWASRLPELQTFLGISHSGLGSLLFVMACGALFAMPFTGALTARFGSHKVCQFTGILLAFVSASIALQNNLYVEGVIFMITGFANGSMDVAMNEQAVLVERAYQKPIMSSFHAFWSIGMAIGAGSGAIFAKAGIPLKVHMFVIAGFALISFLWASNKLIKVQKAAEENKPPAFILPNSIIAPLGFIAFCGMLSEGSMIDWSAIYINEVVGSSKTISAISFGVFGAAMTLGRIFGDYFTLRLGKKKLLVIDSILAIVGLSVVLLFPVMPITTIGLFLIGIGLSTIVPIVYSTAGNTPGVSPGIGISMATTIGYSGFFIGPTSIGYLGDHYGLRIALVFTLVLLLLMFVLILIQRFKA
ncbi:MAG: MFS transporter [Cytophagales bacterium]|nr:MFS transporter [Cytophagales bacterium]